MAILFPLQSGFSEKYSPITPTVPIQADESLFITE
jgi:hypothetical protein